MIPVQTKPNEPTSAQVSSKPANAAPLDLATASNPGARGSSGAHAFPCSQMLAIFAYAMVSCLLVNDTIKVALIRRRIPTATA